MTYHYLWPDIRMLVHILVSWLLSALALWLVAQFVPGIGVKGFGSAMIATVVIAIVNATLGTILRFLAFPLTFITLGLFSLVINAFLLWFAALFTPGFRVRGFISALLGSLVLTIVNYVLHLVVRI
jgi:putative membrane protein